MTASYYERSLTSLATLLVEKGVVTPRELEERAGGRFPLAAPARRDAATSRRASNSRSATACAYATTTSRATSGCPATSAARPVSWSASRLPIRSPTRTRTVSKPKTSRRTTCGSAARTCGRNRADPALVHVGVFQSYLSARLDDIATHVAQDALNAVKGGTPKVPEPSGGTRCCAESLPSHSRWGRFYCPPLPGAGARVPDADDDQLQAGLAMKITDVIVHPLAADHDDVSWTAHEPFGRSDPDPGRDPHRCGHHRHRRGRERPAAAGLRACSS